jgi:hypothetical protein
MREEKSPQEREREREREREGKVRRRDHDKRYIPYCTVEEYMYK